MGDEAKIQPDEVLGLRDKVKGAVLWRSGSQIVAQLIAWSSTFVVIRLLSPADYGLFAMAQLVLVFLTEMSGSGFAYALVRTESVERHAVRQAFGMLLLLNAGLAILQLLLAPFAAAYFRQPIVADVLRVQALLFLFTPFIMLPSALLSREMDFRRQAQVDLVAAIFSAMTALLCARAGFGVWTLVAAHLVLFGVRATMLTIVARSLVWPSFDFAGAGAMIHFGGTVVAVQLLWLVQSQSDVFIGGRMLPPLDLGLYTTSLFLTSILAAKFVPPLNDVAFAAYARIQSDREAVALAFCKGIRLIMLVALPCYLGLAATAEPLVLTMLGAKWAATVPLVRLFALGMPFMTLQILFRPATNALGRHGIPLRCSMAGAIIFPLAFLIGVHFGSLGLVLAWITAFPILTAVTAALSLPVIGVSPSTLVRSIGPGLFASAGMIVPVLLIDSALPPLPPIARLAILVSIGAATYVALLILFARNIVQEIIDLIKKRPEATAVA